MAKMPQKPRNFKKKAQKKPALEGRLAVMCGDGLEVETDAEDSFAFGKILCQFYYIAVFLFLFF